MILTALPTELKMKIMVCQLPARIDVFIIGAFVCSMAACSTTRPPSNAEEPATGQGQVADLQPPPQIIESIPTHVSEIREIEYKKGLETAPDNLLLTGHLFVKQVSNGNVSIKPCQSCHIQLSGISDTSVVINLTTARNGSFKFHGQADPYSFRLKEPGLNNINIDTVKLGEGGSIHMTIVAAQGNQHEQFHVRREGTTFHWVRQ